jgi:hypothetical protein
MTSYPSFSRVARRGALDVCCAGRARLEGVVATVQQHHSLQAERGVARCRQPRARLLEADAGVATAGASGSWGWSVTHARMTTRRFAACGPRCTDMPHVTTTVWYLLRSCTTCVAAHGASQAWAAVSRACDAAPAPCPRRRPGPRPAATRPWWARCARPRCCHPQSPAQRSKQARQQARQAGASVHSTTRCPFVQARSATTCLVTRVHDDDGACLALRPAADACGRLSADGVRAAVVQLRAALAHARRSAPGQPRRKLRGVHALQRPRHRDARRRKLQLARRRRRRHSSVRHKLHAKLRVCATEAAATANGGRGVNAGAEETAGASEWAAVIK